MLEKLKKNKFIPYIIILLSSLTISIIFFTMNLSEYNEARIHIGRIVSIKEVLLEGIFPSFISSKHMLGFGYALNIFYGPITTYIPIIFSFFNNSSITGLKIFTFLTVFLSGITQYNFLFKISKKKLLSLIGSLIYISAPYRITDIYSRDAVGEYCSFIFIPLVFQGMYELLYENKNKHYLIIIGAVGLILSHTITTIYVIVFSLVYLLINYSKVINKEVLKKLSVDFLIILLLTCFYLFPLLEHKFNGNYTIFNSEEMGATGEKVQQTGLQLKDFLASEFGTQEIVFSLGIVIIFSLLLTPFCIKKQKKNETYIIFLIFSIISLWMCTKYFPWIIMPSILTITQFAWRLEGFFIFFISYICAENIICISNMINDKKVILANLIIIFSFICSFFVTYRYFNHDSLQKDIEFENTIIQREKIGPYNINREYLPINAINNISYIENREDRVYLNYGTANITNEIKDGLNMEFEIDNVQSKVELELPYIYYNGYTVTINNKKIKTFESEKGFLCINLSEEGKVVVKYTGTLLDKLGYLISGSTLIILIIYIIIKYKK